MEKGLLTVRGRKHFNSCYCVCVSLSLLMLVLVLGSLVKIKPTIFMSKGHCHGDFAVFWFKELKYLTKNLSANMKSLLEHREEIIRDFSKEELILISFYRLL